MKYKVLDFPNIENLPKTKEQLIENAKEKIKRLNESDDEKSKLIAENLENALEWLQSILLKELNDKSYYRIGFYEKTVNCKKEKIFNIQIWKKYMDEIDIQEKIVFSNCDEDLDNDEDTIIVH